MEGIFVSILFLGIITYFFLNGSGDVSKTKTTTKLSPPPANTNTQSTSENHLTKTDSYLKSSSTKLNQYSTTGEFARSTEGFIPEDKCECGGQWVKHVNRTTGGRFFGCSRYPSCDNTRDKQQTKNFCSNGHARTRENTLYNSDGSRRCLVCRPLPKATRGNSSKRSNTVVATSQQSSVNNNLYCKNGHKRTNENTYIRPDGERECRVCRKNARH